MQITQARPNPMQQFHDMVQFILDHGVRRPNRTGTDTLFVPGYHMKFDLNEGVPILTTKKVSFENAKGELIGFFRGFDNAAQFRAIDCKVWTANANKTTDWLASDYRKGEDDLGRIYGKQWTDWRDWREATSEAQAQKFASQGYELIAHDVERKVWVYRRGINQLEVALHALMTNPTDRRIIVTGWRPDEADQQALPVCHVDYVLSVDTDSNTLHLCMLQRSYDTFLAYNSVLGALFLAIFAKLSGLKAGTFNHFIADAHVYVNHIEQAELLLSREHRMQPKLVLGSSIPTLTSVDQIKGVFERIQPEDITLEGYDPHPAIPAPMAA